MPHRFVSASSLDEPFTLYGLLAETIDVADDGKSVTFALNPNAKFSDRLPVTPEDVITSFELLKTKGRPNHRTYFAKVTKAEKIGERSVRFTFEDASDRELPFILGLMPVFAAHATTPEKFETSSMTPLVGSGPYTVSRVDAGRSISFARDKDYWGRDLPVNRGRFNFDEVRFDYFRDASVMLEAFKSGAIDLRLEDDPGRWADAYDIDAVHDGRIVKAEFDIGLPAGMTALVFNTRRAVFSDPRVRRALMTLFDFEWVNRTLYNGLFKRTTSYFERSYLASTGRPADARERALLAPFPNAVRPEFLEGTYQFPISDGSGQNRANQKAAYALLTEAGMVLKGGRLVNAKTGKPLAFEILANSNAQEALLLSYARSLEPLGIAVRVRVVDSAQYQERLASFRLRHDPEHVAVVAVAGQRAAFPLVGQDGRCKRLVQFRRRQEPGRRRDDRCDARRQNGNGFHLRRSRARSRAAFRRLRRSAILHAAPVGRLLGAPQASR